MSPKKRPTWRISLIATLILTMIACEFLFPEPTVPPVVIEPPEIVITATPDGGGEPDVDIKVPEDIHNKGFARFYKAVPVALPERFYETSYTLPVALEATTNSDLFTFSPAQEALLRENGFVVGPGEWLEFFQPYESLRYQDVPVFITTDSIYHVYHLLFDKLLRDLERESLAPTLVTLTDALVEEAAAQLEETRGTALEDPARRVLGYFAVAQQLISETPPPIPDAVANEVTAELELIRAHDMIAKSPLLTLPESLAEGPNCDPGATPDEAAKFYCEDYSQYVPRGHYTRDEQLQRYFRTMMWYGRINLRLKQVRETQMALLITRLIRRTSIGGTPASELWSGIYDPTVFLVGKSDDLSFHEYGPLMDVVYGEEPELDKLADDAYLTTFIDVARTLPPPQINSMWVYIWEDEDDVTQGFRFMGQRFVLDAYIFEQLIHREVDRRMLPKGLDVFAAMGNEEAYTILDEMGETEYTNYTTQMEKVRGEIASLELDSWTQNLYWNWLYALQAVATPKGEAYPAFMQTQAWARKDLHTALGSWTELKHDTILYA
ncbi:MAG: DUF3160 domain-containing protein, partial [Anaerolineae bacterium]|nr:DUF3160 domain-containing protein [Anaerolineae bacterium]